MRKLLISLIFLGCIFSLRAQDITKAEYFIDTDLGFGRNTDIPVTSPGTEVELEFILPLDAIDEGLHMLYIRTQDANGKWSIYGNRMFLKISEGTTPSIVAAEYFFDNDPGLGNGRSIDLSASAPEILVEFEVSLAGLPDGLHFLYVRAKDDRGRWSILANRLVQVIPHPDDFKIQRLDYHFEGPEGFVSSTFIQEIDPEAYLVDINYQGNTAELTFGETYTLVSVAVNNTGRRGLVSSIEFDYVEKEPIIASVETQDASCPNTHDGVIAITASGGNGGLLYSLDSVDFTDHPIFKNVSPGEYTVIITANSEEVITETVTISATFETPPVPMISSLTNAGTIFESSALTGNQWLLDDAPIAGANSRQLLPRLSGNYQVMVTNSNGCSSVSDPVIFEGVPGAERFDFNQKIVASDREGSDNYGYAVAQDGNFAVIGSPGEDHDASGNNFLTDSGAAYLLEQDENGLWQEIQKIVPEDRGATQVFGSAVAISKNYLAVGAPQGSILSNVYFGAGAVYIFERNGNGQWVQAQKLEASDAAFADGFGLSVAISENRLIVGALLEDEDANGGNTALNAGSAYIFERAQNGIWSEVKKIVSFDRDNGDSFGWSVSISGDYAVVGSPSDDEDANGDNFMSASGSVYLFERAAKGTWTQIQKITASDRTQGDTFGFSVDMDGNRIVIGAPNKHDDTGNLIIQAGAAYIFEPDDNDNWAEVQKLVAADRDQVHQLGWSTGLSGRHVIGGAFGDGSAYVFRLENNGVWQEIKKIGPPPEDIDNGFGWSSSINAEYALVGAYMEDKDQFGENSLRLAGAVYGYGPCISSSFTPDVADLPDLTSECPVASINPPSATSDCGGKITGVADVPFPITSPGETIVTWTYTDGSNSTTQEQRVIILPIDNSVTENGNTLVANASGLSYQWLDCDNGNAPLSGETGQSFSPTENGTYAVEISNGTCSVISECVTSVVVTGVDHIKDDRIMIYPNPVEKFAYLDLRAMTNPMINILDTNGRVLKTVAARKKIEKINFGDLQSGVYFVKIVSAKGISMMQIIKN